MDGMDPSDLTPIPARQEDLDRLTGRVTELEQLVRGAAAAGDASARPALLRQGDTITKVFAYGPGVHTFPMAGGPQRVEAGGLYGFWVDADGQGHIYKARDEYLPTDRVGRPE